MSCTFICINNYKFVLYYNFAGKSIFLNKIVESNSFEIIYIFKTVILGFEKVDFKIHIFKSQTKKCFLEN
jgi:hypothetical protein